jgi:3-deoxy-D-manno-octulosonic-acid transferase
MIYNIFIRIAAVFIPIAALFFPKLRERQQKARVTFDVLNKLDKTRKNIWFHAASVGEFEQAKPVIELLRAKYPDMQFVCSFQSPSAFNTQQNYPYANAIVYLPIDIKRNVSRFLDKIHPQCAVFVRYEIWRNYLEELRSRSIPTILINATQPKIGSLRRKALFENFFCECYNLFTRIYTVSQAHTEYFKKIGVRCEILTLSDTRFDRIIEKVEQSAIKPILPKELFDDDEFVLVAGSSWQQEEAILSELKSYSAIYSLQKRIRLIITPHEPTATHIATLIEQFPDSILLSQLLEMLDKFPLDTIRKKISSKTIIVDSVGKLLRLYAVADAAFVGGAFGVGVHSLTEPAGYGIPLASGFNIQSSPDAAALLECGALTVVRNADEFTKWLALIVNNSKEREQMKAASKNYVYSAKGSSSIIAGFIEQLFD